MKKSIGSIRKVYIVCAKCGTETILNLGHSLIKCQVCLEDLGVDPMDNAFLKVQKLVEFANKNRNAEVGFICDDEV